MPRCTKGLEHIYLHFFNDTNKFTYTTATFLLVGGKNSIHVKLVQSKISIDYLRKKKQRSLSLHFLERILLHVFLLITEKGCRQNNVYFCSDSTTVLTWLRKEDSESAFVQNRVQEIRKLTPVKAQRSAWILESCRPTKYRLLLTTVVQLKMVGGSQ
ncbi:hypothetical protein NPIL_408001 [Nephila pilipes]|uniref:Uncharacterized protein n=1 Tax=Nephila pilipes TaxID=299642 RepID=A0A8X6U038_NEPPI|nr:hypothetical protein NPIL_408001 [Nephila pilipes]